MNKPAGYKESPALDNYHLDIVGVFVDRSQDPPNDYWWWSVEFEHDGVCYECQGTAETRGACFDAVWAYRAEVVAG